MGKYNWDKKIIEEAVKNSYSYRETLRYLNFNTSGNNTSTLKRKIEEYNIDISHFTFSSSRKPKLKHDISEYLQKNGRFIHSYKLKEKLFEEGIKENKCEICGNDTWLGKKLVCQLHHINGDNRDNRLENLQILCPNCHSQTENYCGSSNKSEKEKHYCKVCGRELKWKHSTLCPQCSAKNRGKMNLSKEEFIAILKKYKGNRMLAGKEIGISETSVRNWCMKFGLPKASKDLKNVLV